jgi:hypothetical protein
MDKTLDCGPLGEFGYSPEHTPRSRHDCMKAAAKKHSPGWVMECLAELLKEKRHERELSQDLRWANGL